MSTPPASLAKISYSSKLCVGGPLTSWEQQLSNECMADGISPVFDRWLSSTIFITQRNDPLSIKIEVPEWIESLLERIGMFAVDMLPDFLMYAITLLNTTMPVPVGLFLFVLAGLWIWRRTSSEGGKRAKEDD